MLWDNITNSHFQLTENCQGSVESREKSRWNPSDPDFVGSHLKNMLLQWNIYLCLGRKKVLSWAMLLLCFSQYIIWDLGTSRCCLSNLRFLCPALRPPMSLAFLLHLAKGVLFSFEASTGLRLTFLLVCLISFTPVSTIFFGPVLFCLGTAIITNYDVYPWSFELELLRQFRGKRELV